MALSSRKISTLQTRESLNGDEYLMVAFNNKSYKVRTSLFISDIISSIDQQVVKGDSAASPITITTSDGEKRTFYVRNGATGSTGKEGPKGKKGETGNAGVALYNTDFEDIILDNLDGLNSENERMSDEELTSYALSAEQGSVLNTKLEALAEEYLTQDEYDERLSLNKIDANIKYFIMED